MPALTSTPNSPPHHAIDINDEDYQSSEDEDFDPTKAPSDENVSSGSDVEGPTATKSRKGNRQKKSSTDAEDLGFQNSGDEATIRKAKKRKRRGKDGGNGEEVGEDSDEGGEGGVVRTRAMRKVEEKEKKPLASAEGTTVDIDALWKSMNNPLAKAESRAPHNSNKAIDTPLEGAGLGSTTIKDSNGQHGNAHDSSINEISSPIPNHSNREDMITIKRSYVFAGETITEQKSVPKSSAEARLFLQSQQQVSSTSPLPAPSSHPPLRRPKKRISRFEPNPNGIIKGLPSQSVASKANKGPKLNVVEKSKLDWAGYVDKEGMKDELDVAEKAKDGYLSKMDFLGRVDAKREEELRHARTK